MLQGQLAFVKEPFLRPFLEGNEALDSSVMVGFEGGLTPAQVETRLGILALEAMAGPILRGAREVLVLLPCNTLAPVSWALQKRFSATAGLEAMLEEAGAEASVARGGVLQLAADAARVRFPTVPEAVLMAAGQRGCHSVLPLGTQGIAATYPPTLPTPATRWSLYTALENRLAVLVSHSGNAGVTCSSAVALTSRALEDQDRQFFNSLVHEGSTYFISR